MLSLGQAFFHKFFSRKNEMEKVKSAKVEKKLGRDDDDDDGDNELEGDMGVIEKEVEKEDDDSDDDEAEIWKVMSLLGTCLNQI